MSSQRQRSQAGYWTDVAQQLSEIASSVNYSTEAQLRHRMALVEFWEPAGVFYIVGVPPVRGGVRDVGGGGHGADVQVFPSRTVLRGRRTELRWQGDNRDPDLRGAAQPERYRLRADRRGGLRIEFLHEFPSPATRPTP